MAHLELYQRLGFDNNEVSKEEIKKRYRKLVKDCHPDSFPDDPEKEQTFKFITAAYEVLKDDKKRKEYDETGDTSKSNEEEMMRGLVINTLTAHFLMMMDEMPEEVLDTHDIRLFLIRKMNEMRAEKLNASNQIKSILRKLLKAKSKLKIKEGKDDILAVGIRNRHEHLTAKLKEVKFHIKVLDKIVEILNDYSYDFTAPTNTYMSMNQMIQSGNFTLRLGSGRI